LDLQPVVVEQRTRAVDDRRAHRDQPRRECWAIARGTLANTDSASDRALAKRGERARAVAVGRSCARPWAAAPAAGTSVSWHSADQTGAAGSCSATRRRFRPQKLIERERSGAGGDQGWSPGAKSRPGADLDVPERRVVAHQH